ncbi:hypothetical protein [Mycobacterium sp. 94-17]|uniref:hypothetical protein n=1 Tax=Mycobacterium sp. 94-17 TaxID=2986147 RepID=UPI002D1F08A6|nr:hypothetical protein [Mycobacterium sp. 94-17]MEB4208053.1 hypothetical protein [Mycobacterium sp. 94-17]
MEPYEPDADLVLPKPLPATLAFRAPVAHLPDKLAALIDMLLNRQDTEIAVWGDGPVECSRPLDTVQHRIGHAAQAFKAQALRAAGLSPTAVHTEVFRGCTPWYRLDSGADFEPIAADDAAAR